MTAPRDTLPDPMTRARARALVANPALLADRPDLRGMCWQVLRGYPFSGTHPVAAEFRLAKAARAARAGADMITVRIEAEMTRHAIPGMLGMAESFGLDVERVERCGKHNDSGLIQALYRVLVRGELDAGPDGVLQDLIDDCRCIEPAMHGMTVHIPRTDDD